jgi:phosphoglycolate phosphatase-like HAD superfamily hydrolase
MVGDSTWDCIAAGKLGVPTLAVRTGGFSTEELIEAGAERVFDSLRELVENLDHTPLAGAER